MQKGRVLRINSFGVIEFFRKNSFFLTIAFIFTLGVVIGVFTVENFEYLKNYAKQYITDYIELRQLNGFWTVFLDSLLSALSQLFLFFVLGTSLFGVITVPSGVLLKGMLQGGITAYTYSAFGLRGIAFNAIILVPATVVLLIVLMVGSRESVKFSLKVSSLTLNKTLPFNLSQDFKDYSVKYLILAVCCIIYGILDAVISKGLIKHFSLTVT